MTYAAIAAIIVAAIVLLTFRKSRNEPTLPYENAQELRDFMRDLKARALALSESERLEMVEEARRLAHAGYDRLFDEAKRLGKDDAFAHQAGVLDAVFCVFANDDRMRKHDEIRRLMQLETIPFNLCPSVEGKPAVTEYLVWKFSPQDADVPVIEKAISRFVDKISADAEQDDNPDQLMNSMIYSHQFDWQALASKTLDKSLVEQEAIARG